MADGEDPVGAVGYGRLIGELTRLQVRYPKLIHHLSRDHHSISIWYYIEDLAIECVRLLRVEGVHAEHHTDEARAVQLPTTSPMPEEHQKLLLETLESFLERCTMGSL